jgi:hypothetical protein
MVAMVVSVFMSCGAGLDATDAGEGNDAGGGSAAGGGAAAGGGLATGGGAATGGGSATGGGAGTDAGQPCTTDTWTNWGKAFFASNCVSCHTYNHASMGQQSYVRSDASGISFRVSVGDMPRGASLSSTDRARVEKYVNCGAP